MKKFPFLLLDAGPIIKLFKLDIWDAFIEECAVTISRTVLSEAKWAGARSEDVPIELSCYEENGRIQVIDLDLSVIKAFYDRFDLRYKADIDDGEKETLAFLCDAEEEWRVCSSDHAVFRVLGLLGRGEQGISLEELLGSVGLGPPPSWKNLNHRDKNWKYTKKFREEWTRRGKEDFVQSQGLA
jgi:hypothetical protein